MIFLILGASYLLGSVSFAIIAGYVFTGEDIRKKGSGNAGATNVFRILGWRISIPVLSADFLKGFLPVILAPSVTRALSVNTLPLSVLQLAIIFCVLLGHVFPIWFGFKGGKGVAAAAGGVSALFPPAAPICLLVFALVTALSRYVSLASLVTAWFLPLFYSVYMPFTKGEFSIIKLLFFIFIALIITILHRSNIVRLMKGEERKIAMGGKK